MWRWRSRSRPRLVCAGAVRAGAASAPLELAQLAAAAAAAHLQPTTVLVDVSGESLGGGAAQWGAARLADSHAAAGCWLRPDRDRPNRAAAALAVRAVAARPLPAGAELTLWPHPALAAAADIPFLTPRHLDGWSRALPYVCPECGARFAEPFPLKAHLAVGCGAGGGAPSAALFWAELLRRLLPLPPPLPPPPTPPPPALTALPPSGLSSSPARGHRCLWCGKVYSRRYGLKIHVRTHTGAKPLSCGQCGRAFADPSNLNKHRRLHARPAPPPPPPPSTVLQPDDIRQS